MKKNSDQLEMATQFSVFLVNKPGVLARVCQQLADNRVNLFALSMMDSSEHGVLRLVAENEAVARQALQRLGLHTAETTVLLATLPNRAGALADVVERLSAAHIDVSYAYCTAGARGGKAVGVFKVSNPAKATQILTERKPRRKDFGVLRVDGRVRRR